MFKRIFNSATWMTWFALASRVGGVAMLLPLVLSQFSDADVTLWLLFMAISNLQLLADMGFSQTFSRAISYGFSKKKNVTEQNIDNTLMMFGDINAVICSMHWIYKRLTLIAFILLITIGSFSVAKPIAATTASIYAWASWFVMVVGITIFLYGNSYTAFIIGANRIELLKKYETVINIFSLATQAIVLLLGYGFLHLVIIWQFWQVVQVIINRMVVKKILVINNSKTKQLTYDPSLLRAMWASAWRSALGISMAVGVTQGMVIVIANILPSLQSAGILVAFRLVQTLSLLSQAPFYTKIPEMNGLRLRSELIKLSDIASNAIFKSLMVFTLGAIFIGAGVYPFLDYINSDILFPSSYFWMFLVWANFCERYGGMHIQLYTTTNHIVWHIANGITGVLWVGFTLFLFPIYGPVAFPVSMLCGYLLFYTWYAAYLSHKSLPGISFWSFEAKATLLPLFIMMLYILLTS